MHAHTSAHAAVHRSISPVSGTGEERFSAVGGLPDKKAQNEPLVGQPDRVF
jgi:hypothetical protein